MLLVIFSPKAYIKFERISEGEDKSSPNVVLTVCCEICNKIFQNCIKIIVERFLLNVSWKSYQNSDYQEWRSVYIQIDKVWWWLMESFPAPLEVRTEFKIF